jgi:hypothetical protein
MGRKPVQTTLSTGVEGYSAFARFRGALGQSGQSRFSR